jgi:hypothetical protein
MRFSLFVVCTFFVTRSLSQNAADSVDIVINSSATTHAKISALYRLSKNSGPLEIGKAETALLRALDLALDLGERPQIAESYHLLGDLYRRHSDYFVAISSYALRYATTGVPQIHCR